MSHPDRPIGRRALVRAGVVLGAGAVMTLTSCTNDDGPSRATPKSSVESRSPGPAGRASRVLLAYFSRPGEQYWNGGRRTVDVGNTAVVADMISDLADVDVYRIRAADPYPVDYEATVERSTRELRTDARPAITGALPRLDGYDTVLLGSPIWGVREPMIMRTFLEAVGALRAKTVHPFVTFAVSGLGDAVEDYTRLCPDATIGQALAIRGEEARQSRSQVRRWLSTIGVT